MAFLAYSRACVTCGVLTSDWCSEDECYAADHIASEAWRPDQNTPLCTRCNWEDGCCRYCRQIACATPGPRASLDHYPGWCQYKRNPVTKWETAAVMAGRPMPDEPPFQFVQEEEVPRDVAQRLKECMERNSRRGSTTTPTAKTQWEPLTESPVREQMHRNSPAENTCIFHGLAYHTRTHPYIHDVVSIVVVIVP